MPLLHLVGLPGQLANGSNRVGVLAQSASAATRFHRAGVSGFREAIPLAIPVCVGAALGAWGITWLGDRQFERLFGVLMLALVIPTLWGTRTRASRDPSEPEGAPERAAARRWSTGLVYAVLLAIGLYGGAVQAGVGIPLVAALSGAGYNLVRANSIKVVINLALVLTALPIFLWRGLIVWPAALALAVGYAAGGEVGARLAISGGESWLRPVILAVVVALAGRMLGLY